MTDHLNQQLITHLARARALEALDLRLLTRGIDVARDEHVRAIYRGHRTQTAGHLRLIDERLGAHASQQKGPAAIGALQLGLAEDAATPVEVAISAFAFENLEVAAYYVLAHLAERCGDNASAQVVRTILAEEEQAADLMAASLSRALTLAATTAERSEHDDRIT